VASVYSWASKVASPYRARSRTRASQHSGSIQDLCAVLEVLQEDVPDPLGAVSDQREPHLDTAQNLRTRSWTREVHRCRRTVSERHSMSADPKPTTQVALCRQVTQI
jgi:hypothetical protein